MTATFTARHETAPDRLTELLGDGRDSGDGADDAATSQVILVALAGYASLVSTGTPVDTERFVRTLERLLPDR
ncbi:hypothetical protein ACWCXL_42250 [Streptomyces sp. NPDC001588]